MMTAINITQEKEIPILAHIYTDKINGHFILDALKAYMCDLECICLDDTDSYYDNVQQQNIIRRS